MDHYCPGKLEEKFQGLTQEFPLHIQNLVLSFSVAFFFSFFTLICKSLITTDGIRKTLGFPPVLSPDQDFVFPVEKNPHDVECHSLAVNWSCDSFTQEICTEAMLHPPASSVCLLSKMHIIYCFFKINCRHFILLVTLSYKAMVWLNVAFVILQWLPDGTVNTNSSYS